MFAVWVGCFIKPLLARKTIAEAKKLHTDVSAERKRTRAQLDAAEERRRQLETKAEEDDLESSELTVLRLRLTEELEDQRKLHKQDLAERDFTIDQTRKKYQGKPFLCMIF